MNNTFTNLGDVARLIGEASAGKPRIIVGIAGPPAAGKSTIAAKLVQLLGPTSIAFGMDGFHLPQATLARLGRRERMGAPDTFDVDGFVDTLARIRNDGDPVSIPGFDRRIEEPTPNESIVTPSFRKVVVEGNYLLGEFGGWERVAPLLDLSFFVRVEHDIRVRRLIARHIEFGKTPDAAAAWAAGPDADNARLIGATAGRADHLIDVAL
ncbi:MAG: nucleoside/nucleotide kinase family protein [Lacisediminihabitans sp.]